MTKHQPIPDAGAALKRQRGADSIRVQTVDGPIVLRQTFREALPHLLARLGRWG